MSIDGVAESPELFLTLWQRFNGAVDEHRRSPETLLRRPRRSPGASMGPSMSIDGVGSTDVTRRRLSVLLPFLTPSMLIDGPIEAACSPASAP